MDVFLTYLWVTFGRAGSRIDKEKLNYQTFIGYTREYSRFVESVKIVGWTLTFFVCVSHLLAHGGQSYLNLRISHPHCFIPVPDDVVQQRMEESNLFRWVSAFREFGHLTADINPLQSNTRWGRRMSRCWGLRLDWKILFFSLFFPADFVSYVMSWCLGYTWQLRFCGIKFMWIAFILYGISTSCCSLISSEYV